MKKNMIYGLAVAMLLSLTSISVSSCRSSTRVRTLNPGDRSVTVVKRPKRKRIKGRTKAVTTRKYNRAPSRK
jgi:MFS superfamily sulfate permease-like transporter